MNLKYFFIGLILFALIGCDSDEAITIVEAPITYDFQRAGVSTVSFGGQTTRILMATELIGAMKNFENTNSDIQAMYANESSSGDNVDPFSNPALNASSKSIKSKVAASKDFFSSNTAQSAKIKADFETWIGAQVTEVFPNQDILAEPGIAGQIADGSSVRYVNSNGLEYNQAVNKALIGALMVDQMLNNYLSTAVLDEADNIANNDAGITASDKSYTTMEHKWDEAYGYLFGMSTDPSNPLANLGEDAFLNKYLSRVEGDSDFTGIAQNIYDALKLGRAAIVAGDYKVRDEQANIVKELISKVVAVRSVYYLQQGKNAIPSSGTDFGGAFHDLSEGFGFVYSLRFLRKPNSNDPYFSHSEVDSFISQLTAGNGFWDISPSTLDDIANSISEKFDFTTAEAGQ
tara:strand:+ start:718 stop:1926 length:1209 start_codon:yes stop_codon:yes gene_type:complete